MRTFWRTADRSLIRDVAALATAVGLVGLSFGAIATGAHLPLWAVVAMSTLVFAGGSQFLAAGLIAAGNPVAAVLAGLLLNARHLPFGMAIGDVLGRGPARLLGSHLMVDESVAFALAQTDPRRRRAAYWLTGAGLFVTWNIGAVAGALLGAAADDPAVFGLDAAFPAGLFALLLPGLRAPARADAAAPWVAGAGALVAVVATPLTPAGLPVLLALVALGLAFVVPVGTAGTTGGGDEAAVPC
jgi:predicted branched-subunit amino acid permease